MPFSMTCAGCDTPYTLADEMRGKKLRCKNCDQILSTPEAAAAKTTTVPAKTRPTAIVNRPPERPKPALATASRNRPRDQEEDDEAPVKRRIGGAQSRNAPKGNSTALILAGAGAFVGVIGIVVAIVVVGGKKKDTPAAETEVAKAPAAQPAGPNKPAPRLPVADQNATPPPAAPNATPPVVPNVDPPAPQNTTPPTAPADVPGVASGARKPLRYQWQGGPHAYALRIDADKGAFLDNYSGTCVINAKKIDRPKGQPAPEERKGSGTGFVVGADGYVITCAHVVGDAIKIDVHIDGKVYPGTVLSLDHQQDLAVVKIAAQNLPTVPLANSDVADIGMEVRAFGFPLSDVLGESLKVTRGTLSGITEQDGRKVFQIDASINPGNSGGPLLTEAGEVLGVNSAKLFGESLSNIGFATPSNEVKRMLTDKGVAFTSGSSATKLEGTALVKQVRPAVVLIKVTMGEDRSAQGYTLSYQGGFAKRQMTKEGTPAGALSNMVPFTRTQIDMSAGGRVLNLQGGNQLPFLLGETGLFIIEPLPPDARTNWETVGVFTVTEGSAARPNPIGIPRRPSPLRPGINPGLPRPAQPAAPAVVTRKGRERVIYTRAEEAGDVVTIKKRYEMHVEGGTSLIGDGEFLFDAKSGVLKSSEFKATFTSAQGRIPITVSYKLVDGAERDNLLKTQPVTSPAQPAGPQNPVAEGDLVPILAALKTPKDLNQKRSTLALLAKIQPNAQRDEVSKLLIPYTTDPDVFTRVACLKALLGWATKENVPSLMQAVIDSNIGVRSDAMTILGQLKDERAAEPLARRLTVLSDRGNAAKALVVFGAAAEKAVIPYLKAGDWPVRHAACQILKEIGTKESKAALELASKDNNGNVANEARQALAAVSARP